MPRALYPISRTHFASYQRLTQKKYRQSERKFLVEGVHLVTEALESDWPVEVVMVTGSFQQKKDCSLIVGIAGRRMVDVREISEREAGKLSETVTSQGVLAVIGMKEVQGESVWKTTSDRSLMVAMESISDPGNVGSILRTCDWFGVDAVLMDSETVELYNPKVVRSSMGAIFHLPIIVDVDLRRTAQEARAAGFSVFVTVVEGGRPPADVGLTQKMMIVLGSEAHGVSSDLKAISDSAITIPKFGRAESLNVGVTAAVVLAAVKLRMIK